MLSNFVSPSRLDPYLPQRAALARIDQLFAAQSIPYLVMKGVYVRECVYPDPALRPAGDVDILISPQDRQRAARVLLDNGYTVHVVPNNLSHEATFSHGGWSILICIGTCSARATPAAT